MSVLAGSGNWDEDAAPTERVAFAFAIWLRDDTYQVSLCDPEDTIWTTDYLGRILRREEGLVHPLKAEAFALSDHIVACDQPVIEFPSEFS